MSKQKGDHHLLIPGADGWEIWTGSSAGGFTLRSATDSMRALDVTGIPSGGIEMAVPVRQLSAVPFRAQTDDLSLLEDLAILQLEKNGIRPALDGGQLTDHFVFSSQAEETHLTAVVMNPPAEGQLPRKSPKAFDISPRCFPLPEDQIAVWYELGRWVFGIGKPGQALYFQVLSGENLDQRAGNEIRLALTQLRIQGLLPSLPTEAVVWTHDSPTDARPEEFEALARGLNLPVNAAPKPAPVWPAPPSGLLPADVRAERLAVKNKRNRRVLVTLLLLAYAGLAVFLYTNLQKAKDAAVAAEKEVSQLSSETQELLDHEQKWDELKPVVESRFHPLEVLLHTYRALPNRLNNRYIRLTKVSLLNQYKEIEGNLTVAREVTIAGNAEQKDQDKIPVYIESLKTSEDLLDFNWEFPPETIDKRSGKMVFTFTGSATVTESQP